MTASKDLSQNPPLFSSQLLDRELAEYIAQAKEYQARQTPRQLVMHPPMHMRASTSAEEHLKVERVPTFCGIRFCNLWRLFNNRIH